LESGKQEITAIREIWKYGKRKKTKKKGERGKEYFHFFPDFLNFLNFPLPFSFIIGLEIEKHV
jgi:hypothetical protein